ncbi:MAG: DUF1232 domain-containing protein [Paludibacteraceae bacterium]|nr:DUF1232 domain-containing protein [Paludibacteraceae bacterium]
MSFFQSLSEKAKNLASESVESVTSTIDAMKNTMATKEEIIQEEILFEQCDVNSQTKTDWTTKFDQLQEQVVQYLTDNSEKLKQWYSDSQMDEKIASVAKKAGGIIIYPAILLYNVLKSPQTPLQDKMFIMAPLAYFILPADIIPDFIAALGYADDSIAVTKSLQTISSSITPALQEETKLQCEEIFGELDEDLLDQIYGIINENQNVILSSFIHSKQSDSKDKSEKNKSR